MTAKQRFTLQTLIVTLIFNGALLGAIYYLAGPALQEANLLSMILGIGTAATLLLWGALQFLGTGEKAAASEASAVREKSAPAPSPNTPAIQILSILQRKGRLIDFLQEDLTAYDDAQIGAAVRNVHDGCKQALDEYIKLEPVYAQEEGSPITLQAGFDARSVRLVGNVVGEPPFKGTLRHKGWRVRKIDLPTQVQEEKENFILAAAEVEVER